MLLRSLRAHKIYYKSLINERMERICGVIFEWIELKKVK